MADTPKRTVKPSHSCFSEQRSSAVSATESGPRIASGQYGGPTWNSESATGLASSLASPTNAHVAASGCSLPALLCRGTTELRWRSTIVLFTATTARSLPPSRTAHAPSAVFPASVCEPAHYGGPCPTAASPALPPVVTPVEPIPPATSSSTASPRPASLLRGSQSVLSASRAPTPSIRRSDASCHAVPTISASFLQSDTCAGG